MASFCLLLFVVQNHEKEGENDKSLDCEMNLRSLYTLCLVLLLSYSQVLIAYGIRPKRVGGLEGPECRLGEMIRGGNLECLGVTGVRNCGLGEGLWCVGGLGGAIYEKFGVWKAVEVRGGATSVDVDLGKVRQARDGAKDGWIEVKVTYHLYN